MTSIAIEIDPRQPAQVNQVALRRWHEPGR